MTLLEEKLLVNILYRPGSEILKGIDPDNINFEKLITIASGHLMLPALFFNIQKKKISYLFPDDFIEYIKNIFEINKARNKILLSEAKELSELLYKNNIKHIFLKGTALLLSEVFDDIGERMIGDIDFIIQHKDEERVKKVLEKNNYCMKSSVKLFSFFKHRHLPKRVNKNKTIALEPHLKLLNNRYRCAFDSKQLLNDFNEGLKTIKTPSKSFLFDHCVYNFQLNDNGFINAKHSHRSIYDIYKLDCKNSLTIENIKKDIFIKHFFLTINKFKIFDIYIKSPFLNSSFDELFKIFIHVFIQVEKICIKNLIIIQLFFNTELRRRALIKIKIHYHHKTLLNYICRWLKS